jgi:hypothetical protein
LNLSETPKNDFKKFFQQPFDTTLLGFSKVTNMLRGAVSQQPVALICDDPLTKSIINKDHKEQNSEGIGNLLDSLTSDNIHTTNNEGFEVVTRVDLGPMPLVERSKPVLETDIEYDKFGRIVKSDELKLKIFRGVSLY